MLARVWGLFNYIHSIKKVAKMLKRKMRIPRTFWRWFSQALFLGLFLFLFRQTDYSGKDEIPYAVNTFFRWDPLVALSTTLAAKTIIVQVLPALVLMVLTVVLGRFFCGWVCPLGTLLDLMYWVVGHGRIVTGGRYRWVKYALLIVILVWAFLGVPIVGYFDPLSLLVRGLTLAIDPAFNYAVSYPFDVIYRQMPPWVSSITEPIYGFLRATILPFHQAVFTLGLVSLVILLVVFFLEVIERRFWCRNVCPLGALLALLARNVPLRWLKWQPGRACHRQGCHTCADKCRMAAVSEPEGDFSPEACNLCLDCIEACPRRIVTFRFRRTEASRSAPMGVSRRVFLGALATGIVAPAFLQVVGTKKQPDPALIRPPGALEEGQFLNRCVRCGECMKVCINNALQPAWLEAGVEGAFTPRLIPRLGYCEYNCTLCGQVCPTGAIERLDLVQKQKTVIGHAWFDKNRCLPWAKGIPCLVCEEHCPVPNKAIKLREATVVNEAGKQVVIKQPYVVDRLCIGCGICEYKCPLPGRAAVQVTNAGESRNPRRFDLPAG